MSLQAAIFKPDWHQVFDGKASAVCGPTVELQIQKLKCVNTKTDTNTIFVGDPYPFEFKSLFFALGLWREMM